MAFRFITDVDNNVVIGNQDYGSANQTADFDIFAFNTLFKHGGKIIIKILNAETLFIRITLLLMIIFGLEVFVHYRRHRRIFLFLLSAAGDVVFFCHWFNF